MRRHYVLGAVLVLLALAVSSTPTAAAEALEVTLVKLTSPTTAGNMVTLTIKTATAAQCKVQIRYRSITVPLAPKTTSDEGTATWSWRVPTEVAHGNLPIDVQCTQGDKKGVLTVQLLVN